MPSPLTVTPSLESHWTLRSDTDAGAGDLWTERIHHLSFEVVVFKNASSVFVFFFSAYLMSL